MKKTNFKSRIIMMRKKGMAGPFFQKLNGGMMIKSVGNTIGKAFLKEAPADQSAIKKKKKRKRKRKIK